MTDYKIRYRVTGSDIGYAGENRKTKNVDKGETKVSANSPEEAKKKFNSKKTELRSYQKVRDAVSGRTPRVSVDRISSGPAGNVTVHYESKSAKSMRLRQESRLSEGQPSNIARRHGAAASQSPSLRSGFTKKALPIRMKKGGMARKTRVF